MNAGVKVGGTMDLLAFAPALTLPSETPLTRTSARGGECSFQKYGSRNFFVKFLRSSSLDFCANCQRLGVSNFCKVVTDNRSRSRILKGKIVSGSQRKTTFSPSR